MGMVTGGSGEFRVVRHGFQVASDRETEAIVAASGVESWMRWLLEDVGGVDQEEDEFVILAQADDRARRIGPWLVNTAQVAGSSAGGFVAEFIVEDDSGSPQSYRSLRLFRPDLGHGETLEDRMMHGTKVAMCLFRCFLDLRDLSAHFDLAQSWSDADGAVDFCPEPGAR